MFLCEVEGMEQLPGRSGDDRGKGPVLLALHGSGLALLDDVGGGREGGQGESDLKAKMKVRRHADVTLSVWHGPRRLAKHAPAGELLADGDLAAAA